MYRHALTGINRNNLISKGNNIVLGLFKENIVSKYQVFGSILYIESTDNLNTKIDDYEIYNARLRDSRIENIYSTIKEIVTETKEVKSFAIRVNRKGEHKYSSTELAREVASAVFEIWPKTKVDLSNPEREFNVEIINNRSLIYS